MTDAELGAELDPENPHVGAFIVARKLTPEKRAAYQRLVEVGRDLNLWTAGIGPKPSGVIVCKPRCVR